MAVAAAAAPIAATRARCCASTDCAPPTASAVTACVVLGVEEAAGAEGAGAGPKGKAGMGLLVAAVAEEEKMAPEVEVAKAPNAGLADEAARG